MSVIPKQTVYKGFKATSLICQAQLSFAAHQKYILGEPIFLTMNVFNVFNKNTLHLYFWYSKTSILKVH